MASFSQPALREALNGISGILVTPFDAQDHLVAAPLQPVVDRAVAAGVHVLVANGNTSEFYGLQASEAERGVQIAAQAVAGRVPLVAGVGRSVHEACALARISRAAGANALMVHQPPDPFVAPRGVEEYVRRIADAAGDLPLVLYLRNENIGLPAIEALCRIPQVMGIK
ncbi:MAG: dihydrodipicolinate synthase family protein, partial [Comamonadaceae bacterium]